MDGQTLRYSQPLPDKILHLAYAPATQTLLVSMSKRQLWTYNLRDLAAGTQAREVSCVKRESALKLLTGSVACMADGKGWASGSLEGRVAVDYFDDSAAGQGKRYAYKAHRQTVDGVDYTYPVNALAYHPVYVLHSCPHC
jgi:cell cycle arrest protein BUB3